MEDLEKYKATVKMRVESAFAFAEFYREEDCLVIRTDNGKCLKVVLDEFQAVELAEFISNQFPE